MTLLRVPYRLLRIAGITLSAALTILLARLLRRSSPGRWKRLRNRAFRFWGRDFCRTLGMRIEVRGQPPTGAFFLVANHVSYTDIPFLAAHVDAAFVAKADLRAWPLLGRAFRTADTIFIDRGRKRDLLRVMDQATEALERGLGVLAFPEATSSKGESILPFKPSLLQLAAENGKPVHYVTVSYRTPPGSPPAHRLVCWWDGTPFLWHLVRLLALPGFEASIEFGAEPIADSDRKALAARLRRAMARCFQPIA